MAPGGGSALLERPLGTTRRHNCDDLLVQLSERDSRIAGLEAECGELTAQLAAYRDEVSRWIEWASARGVR